MTRVQLRRRLAGDAEPRAAHRHAQGATGDSAASSSPTPRRPAARRCCITPRRAPRPRRSTRSRPARRDLPVVVAAASAVSRRVPARARSADSVIDAAVARVLRAKFAARPLRASVRRSRQRGALERPRRRIARWRARRRGSRSCCCRTTRGTLPLRDDARVRRASSAPTPPRRGSAATAARACAGVSILDGIRAAAARRPRALRARAGPRRRRARRRAVELGTDDRQPSTGCAASTSTTIALDGRAARSCAPTRTIDFGWTLNSPARGIPFDWYSVRWTGTLTAPAGGVRRIGVEGNDGYRLYLDGKLVIDNWQKQSYRHDARPT